MVMSILLNTILRINQLKALCPSTKSSCMHLLCINRSGEKRKQTHYFCVLHQSNSQLGSYWVVSVRFWKRNWHKKTEWDERNPEPWINGNVAWYISGIKKEKDVGKPETFPQKEKKNRSWNTTDIFKFLKCCQEKERKHRIIHCHCWGQNQD